MLIYTILIFTFTTLILILQQLQIQDLKNEVEFLNVMREYETKEKRKYGR